MNCMRKNQQENLKARQCEYVFAEFNGDLPQ